MGASVLSSEMKFSDTSCSSRCYVALYAEEHVGTTGLCSSHILRSLLCWREEVVNLSMVAL